MATRGRIGNNKGYVSPLASIVVGAPTVLNLRKNNVTKALYEDRWYASRPYAIGKGDDISIVLDNDVNSKRFDVTLSRRVSLVGSTYGNTNVLLADYDGTMFGPTSPTIFPFEDFALVMRPRAILHPGISLESIWRSKTFGKNSVSVQYALPASPSQLASWSVDYTSTSTVAVSLILQSNSVPPRTLIALTNTCRIAIANTSPGIPTSTGAFWLMTGYNIASLQSDGTDTTVTITSPTGITLTGTGLTNGDTVYLTIDAGIPWIASGVYNVHTISGLTFKVSAATGGPQGPTAGGTSFTTLDSASGANWTNVQVADTVVLGTTFSVPAILAGIPTVVIAIYDSGRCIRVDAKFGQPAVTVPVLTGALTSVSNISAFVSGGPVIEVTTALNADATCPVSGFCGSLTAPNYQPTWLYFGDNSKTFPLQDGINYVKATGLTPSGGGFAYTIDFKLPISATLAGYPQWESEEAYLCPMTAANVCAYLNNLAVCGLSANGKAETSSAGSKIQISTSTIGSVGSVQIRGGLANSALANVRGAATETFDFLAANVVVPTTQTSGFHAEWPVKISNSNPYVKESDLVNRDLVSIVGSTWTVGWLHFYPLWLIGTTYNLNDKVYVGGIAYNSLAGFNTGNDPVSGPPGWWAVIVPGNASVATSHEELSKYWQIERHGNYMAMVWANDGFAPDVSGSQPGDYIVVSNDGITDTVATDNCGTFIITALDFTKNIVYFENAAGVEEDCRATVNLVAMDSLMPGDQIVVSSDVWGAGNRRTFTVATVGYVSDGLAPTFTTVETPSPLAYPPAILGPQPTVQVISGRLHSFVKTINSIVPLPEDPTYSVIGLKKDANDVNIYAMGENYGSQLSALDKFGFTVATTIGTDGYAHSVGLIGEADKVMYGYETDPVSYPGVVAAGSNINISGPLVKRIQVGLSLRVRGTTSVVFEAVRGAVATFVNNSKVGESIAISDIISVASSIGGVEAVSVSSPTYTTTADRITVQPYEKALVLQPELDITLTLIG